MVESENLKLELESKTRALKQLEAVYKTSTSPIQKRRVLKEIKDVKKLIRTLKGRLFLEGFSAGASKAPREEETGFSLLSLIGVSRYRDDSKDREIDAVVSFSDFFEKNYLPILSDYYIKLDFSHSIKRDTFYPKYMEIKKLLKEYDYELDILNREEYNSIAHVRGKSVLNKIRQRFLMLNDRFFKELKGFLEDIVDDFRNGGNVILNPTDKINLSEYESNRRLEGYSVIGTLTEMCSFAQEMVGFLSLPDM